MAALILDHQKPNLKHFCKICKKGFGCGRALGGHMRAHGIVADDSPTPSNHNNIFDDDDPDPDPDPDPDSLHHSWDHHNNNNNKPINRRMYALRTNPNRLKTCRVCHNCGKDFFSWKSFLEHGKCSTTSDDDLDDSLLSSPPCSDDDAYDDEDECTATLRRPSASNSNNNNNNWSKRKRSLRVKVGSPASNEEEDLANCLMMLSNGRVVEPMLVEAEAEGDADAEESCASASKEDHHLLLLQQQQDHNHHRNYNYNNIIRKPINFIPPLSYRLPDTEEDNNNNKAKGTVVGGGKGMFECKACKKVFNSHQALGGHRASHKKVKGCFAARLDHMDIDTRENDDVYEDSLFPTKPNHKSSSSSAFHYENPMASASKRKTKVHECSICHRIFSSGQALGGHKRCHWITSNAAAAAAAAAAEAPKFHDKRVVAPPPANFDTITANSALVLPLDLKLDLNLPAPADEVRKPAMDVSTEIHLQSWVCSKKNKVEKNECEEEEEEQKDKKMMRKNEEEKKIVNNESVEEEAESKVKLAKLSELKDMNMSAGNSSPWLQVGIASTTHVVTPDP
ncbi:uncharacterized protein LOC101222211 [Cucumis sativus]|uniref:C2H2-type domain-containing protein n=1 Tax=Cucumis sativus TaxID=3659 RepID=A0A0A0L2Y2_CUCSA|nr:uncharacterized protein LOC101222211 [Cucumis sativus]KGN56355.1 hypothetical protein Csa_010135 [Cucumis sativus]